MRRLWSVWKWHQFEAIVDGKSIKKIPRKIIIVAGFQCKFQRNSALCSLLYNRGWVGSRCSCLVETIIKFDNNTLGSTFSGRTEPGRIWLLFLCFSHKLTAFTNWIAEKLSGWRGGGAAEGRKGIVKFFQWIIKNDVWWISAGSRVDFISDFYCLSFLFSRCLILFLLFSNAVMGII